MLFLGDGMVYQSYFCLLHYLLGELSVHANVLKSFFCLFECVVAFV